MPVPFGFSVGDFVGGIELLLDGIKSLRETNGARDDYRELVRELEHLQNGLRSVEALYMDSTQPIQCSAAKAMVDDCLMRIDYFIQQNSRFSTLDSTPASRWTVAGLKGRWRMVQWALWKKADVVRFKSQVQQHVEAVQMLLASIQINELSAQGKLQSALMQQSADHKKSIEAIAKDIFEQGIEQQRFKRTLDDQHKLVNNTRTHVYSVIGQQRSIRNLMTAESRKIRNQILRQERDSSRNTTQLQTNFQHTNSQVEVLLALQRSVAGGETQYQRDLFHEALQNETRCQTILSNQDTLIQNQKEMLAKLRDIASMARVSQAIPAQVLLSTPVVFLDARGRCAPFHLEFIDCSEAFIAVLKVRFKDIGLRKIEKGQFALEDTTRKRNLHLSDAWSTIVKPGQHISMSMVFRLQESPNGSCPRCGRDNEESNKAEVECANIACRLTYRRIVDFSLGMGQKEGDGELSSHSELASALSIPGSHSRSGWAGNQENTLDEDIKQYTRIQILTLENTSPPPQQKSGATSSYWSVDEKNDFFNLLRYFGTNWQAIAKTIKTKTPLMIKIFYNKKIKEGDFGKYVEEEGARADKLRAEGVNMGPPPTLEKWRNINGMLRESFPPDERARAMFIPREFISRDMVKEKEQRDMQLRQQIHEAREREAKEQKIREQDIYIHPRQIPPQREEHPSTHYNTHAPHLVSDSLRTSLLGQQPSSVQAGTIDFKMDEKARNYLEAQKQQRMAQAQLQLNFKMDEKARNYLEAQRQQRKAEAQLQLHHQQQVQQQAQLIQQQKLLQQQDFE